MIAYETIWSDLYRTLAQEDDDVGKAAAWTTEVNVKRVLVQRFREIPETCELGNRTTNRPDESRGDPEYLVDVAVSADIPGPARSDLGYRRLLLAAEIEWNPRGPELDYDFAKLADVRADRKVFVGGVNVRSWRAVEEPEGIVHRFARFLGFHELVPVGEEFLVVLSAYGTLGHSEQDHSAAWRIAKLPYMSAFQRLAIPPA